MGKHGPKKEDLQEFGLSQELVIRTSERTQSRTGKWVNRELNDLEDVLKGMIDNPPDKADEALLQINLPIRDLDAIDDIYHNDACRSVYECLQEVMT